jgi:hypothetical protein
VGSFGDPAALNETAFGPKAKNDWGNARGAPLLYVEITRIMSLLPARLAETSGHKVPEPHLLTAVPESSSKAILPPKTLGLNALVVLPGFGFNGSNFPL